ncbi:MAG: carboxypeptidase-like regulatory domain-containing protein, partial [Bacteroidaceae bacterium]
MKNSFILLIFVLAFAITNVQAQNIIGRVTDKNNNPIELATIVVQTNDSVYVNSTYTDSLGVFIIKEDVSPFLLTVQHLAYKTYQNKYNSSMLGNIQMDEKEQILSEVSVKGERPLVRV